MVLENVLKANFGESKTKISASFKKTINIAQYESEVLEAYTEITVEENLPAIVRAFIGSALQAQLEYQVLCRLLANGSITQAQYATSKANMELSVNMIGNKMVQVLGEAKAKEYVDKYGV